MIEFNNQTIYESLEECNTTECHHFYDQYELLSCIWIYNHLDSLIIIQTTVEDGLFLW